MANLFFDCKENDSSIIKDQINRESADIARIVERCKYDYPSIVLLNAELTDNKKDESFYKSISNLIWLTCPYLNEKIHDLESQGYISKIEEFIDNDNTLKMMMENAHASYYYFRKNVYRYFVSTVASLDDMNRIFNTGIGGIKNIENIKCLHLHYAHYRICEENVVGKIVYNLLHKKIYCDEEICK